MGLDGLGLLPDASYSQLRVQLFVQRDCSLPPKISHGEKVIAVFDIASPVIKVLPKNDRGARMAVTCSLFQI